MLCVGKHFYSNANPTRHRTPDVSHWGQDDMASGRLAVNTPVRYVYSWTRACPESCQRLEVSIWIPGFKTKSCLTSSVGTALEKSIQVKVKASSHSVKSPNTHQDNIFQAVCLVFLKISFRVRPLRLGYQEHDFVVQSLMEREWERCKHEYYIGFYLHHYHSSAFVSTSRGDKAKMQNN